jgi:hypothetical protein
LWSAPHFKNYMFLAKTTGPSIYIFFTDILFLTEMQKRQPREKGFALIENDITGSESTFKMTDTLQKHSIQP